MPDTPRTILVTEPFESWASDRLRSVGNVIFASCPDHAAIQNALPQADALLVRTFTQVDIKLISCATKLKVIGRAGTGVDNIDLHAAATHGITVVYTPDASTDAVADLTLGFLIALSRGIPAADAALRGGQFHEARQKVTEKELSDLTVGILGMGRIGRAVARRCRNGFGMRIIYHDVIQPGWLDFSAQFVPLEELFEGSDIVSLHVPLTAETRGIVGRARLSRMPKGSILINTSRGAVVDHAALAELLKQDRLGGAGLDVTDPEPLPMDHPLRSCPNLLMTPHIGARTAAAQRRMQEVVEDVIRVLKGQQPMNPCVPDDL